MSAFKQCGRCGFLRPRQAFNRCAEQLDGLQHWCRECQASYHRENRERLLRWQAMRISAEPELREAASAMAPVVLHRGGSRRVLARAQYEPVVGGALSGRAGVDRKRPEYLQVS
jgi:hypothetical protein